jgi:hypothetical protein
MSLTGCKSTFNYAFRKVDGFIIMQNFIVSSYLSANSYITDSTKWNDFRSVEKKEWHPASFHPISSTEKKIKLNTKFEIFYIM